MKAPADKKPRKRKRATRAKTKHGTARLDLAHNTGTVTIRVDVSSASGNPGWEAGDFMRRVMRALGKS